MAKVKGHSAPNSARSTRHDKQGSLDSTVSSGNPSELVQSSSHNGGSGYISDPTFTRRHHKAQPAHMNFTLPRSHTVTLTDNSYKTMPQTGLSVVLPSHVRDLSSAGVYTDMGSRQVYVQNVPGFINRSQLNPQLNQMNGSRALYTPSVVNAGMNVNQTLVQTHASLSGVGGSSVTTVNSKMYQGPPGILAPAPVATPTPTQQVRVLEKSALVNGNENNSQSQPQSSADLCTHRNPQLITTSTPSSSTVTYSTASQMATGRSSCTTCGCTGSHAPQLSAGVQYMPQIWHNNMYPNGILPVSQFPQFYLPPAPYVNGLNQDVINSAMLGMSHPGTAGIANVPNVIYNYCNSFVPPVGTFGQRKPKKLNCHNCGSSKHSANDCTEGSMEAMSGEKLHLLHYCVIIIMIYLMGGRDNLPRAKKAKPLILLI